MKIRDTRTENKALPTREAATIPEGTVFSGIIKTSGVYLRAHNKVIDLKNPHNTWPADWCRSVLDYQELNVELVILP